MRRIGKEEEDAVLEVLRRDPVCLSGYYKNIRGGPSVQAFEDWMASYIGVNHAVACSNGTSALHLALMALGIRPTEQVITTPLSFSATATSILMVGAEPVFVDVDPYTYNIDPSKIEENIDELTKAIIVVHLLGNPCDMTPILRIASKHNIPVIEDNAQALGATYGGWKTGCLGTINTLSFQETKCITSGGEGGMVLINDNDTSNSEALADKVAKLRNHGSQYADAPYVTYNMRMTELQAAFGLAQMNKLDYFNKLQADNAKRFMDASSDARLPFYFQTMAPHATFATRYIIGSDVAPGDADKRKEYVERLTNIGVNKNLPGATIGLGYTRTIMDLPVLQRYKRSCPVAEDLVKRFIWFDLRWKTPEEFEPICDCLIDIAQEVWK